MPVPTLFITEVSNYSRSGLSHLNVMCVWTHSMTHSAFRQMRTADSQRATEVLYKKNSHLD